VQSGQEQPLILHTLVSREVDDWKKKAMDALKEVEELKKRLNEINK
jgi:hypothetical protein